MGRSRFPQVQLISMMKKLLIVGIGAGLLPLIAGMAPANAALMQFEFSNPGEGQLSGSSGEIFLDTASPNNSTTPGLGIYQGAITDYKLNIQGSKLNPGMYSSNGEKFKISDAQVSIDQKNSAINFSFGYGAKLDFKLPPTSIQTVVLSGISEIKTNASSVTFTPGTHYTTYLKQTSISVTKAIPKEVPENSFNWGMMAFGTFAFSSIRNRRQKLLYVR